MPQFKMMLAAFLLMGTAGVFGAEPAPVKEKKPVILPPLTEKEIEQGKENVKRVYEELTQLFQQDNMPVTMPTASMKAMKPAYCKIIKGSNKRATIVYRPRYTTAKQVFRALDGIIYGQVYIEMIQEQNLIALSAPETEIESYRSVMEAMDVPTPQVLIEAKVVEVTYKDGMQRNFAFSWDNKYGKVDATTTVPGTTSQPTSGAGANYAFTHGSNTFNLQFRWLLTAQDARILSSPNILVTRNDVSRIVTGSDTPIQEANTTSSTTTITTKYKRVGVSLEVEPLIINDDNVTLRVYPSVSSITDKEAIKSGQNELSVPVISVRNVESRLRMQDGQIAMLGGLYSSGTRLYQERIPLVSDIPFLGELFTGKNYSKEITHLIFFIKVRVIPPDKMPKIAIGDPERAAALSEDLGAVISGGSSIPVHKNTLKSLKSELEFSMPQNKLKARKEIDAKLDKAQRAEKKVQKNK